MKVGESIAAQLALHFVMLDCDDEGVKSAQRALAPLAQKSHRWKE